jgi:transaldolase
LKIYADGANRDQMIRHSKSGKVHGFTTNPSLLAKAGVKDYAGFAKSILSEIKDLPISFEVFADEFEEMERQAEIIGSWGKNVNIKIPIVNTKGASALPLIRKLLDRKHALNVTAVFTQSQVNGLLETLKDGDRVYISIFAGRMADNGINPLPLVERAVEDFCGCQGTEILWASTREVWNFYQAEHLGCHIITAPDDLIDKYYKPRMTAEEASLDTVKIFDRDSKAAGFRL